jgi:hypothetical protein
MSAGSKDRSPAIYTGNKSTLCTIASRPRAPTSADIMQPETGKRYPVGFFWIVSANPSTGVEGDLWYLTKYSGGLAYWQLADQGGDPGTITGNDGVPLTPTAGNWNVYGQYSSVAPTAHNVETNVSGTALYIEDRTSTTDFVVDPSTAIGARGTFDTISAAMTAASAGDTIFLKAGTYVESFELKAGVNIAAYGNSGFTPGVTIKGKITFTQAGFCTISGVELRTNADYALSVTGGNVSRIYLVECNVIAEDFAAIQLSTTGAGSSIRLINCWGRTNAGAAATNYFVVTGAGGLTFWNVNIIDNDTPQSTPSTFASTGGLLVKFSIIRFPITTTGGGRISGTNSEFNTFQLNSTPLNVGATASGLGNYVRGCTFLAGNTTAITINKPDPITNVTLNMIACSVVTTSAAPVTGDGTLVESGTSFIGNNPIPSSSTLTFTRNAFDPGALWGNWSGVAPAAGYVGEQISSFIRDTSAVDLTVSGTIYDVTTISLTPGTWDVSGLVMFTGITTGTRQTASVGSSSASIPNISYGNNTTGATFVSTTVEDVGLAIPSFRVNIPVAGGAITYYLIARATFSAGTPKAYGRISATRVC